MLSHFLKLHCKKRKIHFPFLSISFQEKHFHFSIFQFICDRDRIRTCDRLLRRQMLYPAELRDLIFCHLIYQFICDRDSPEASGRTCDRLLRRQMLYPPETSGTRPYFSHLNISKLRDKILSYYCRGSRIRTCGLLLPKQAR